MAAEIRGSPRTVHVESPASMRPRRMAAEITPPLREPFRRSGASMRPRRMAAEIAVNLVRELVQQVLQ